MEGKTIEPLNIMWIKKYPSLCEQAGDNDAGKLSWKGVLAFFWHKYWDRVWTF
jgi:hypothetical protein